MARVLRTAAIIVGVVGAVASGVGAIGVIAGVDAIAGVSVGTIAAIGAGASLVGGVGTALTAKPPNPPAAQGSPTDFKLNPDAPVPYVVGRSVCSGLVQRRVSA